jgi:hypothetical protein
VATDVAARGIRGRHRPRGELPSPARTRGLCPPCGTLAAPAFAAPPPFSTRSSALKSPHRARTECSPLPPVSPRTCRETPRSPAGNKSVKELFSSPSAMIVPTQGRAPVSCSVPSSARTPRTMNSAAAPSTRWSSTTTR